MNTLADLVASVRLIAVDRDGREQGFVVGVGRPHQRPTGEWACPTLSHDARQPQLIYGENSLQALCLGLSFIRLRLEDLFEEGGRLLLAAGRDEVSRRDLDAWFSRVGGGSGTDRE
jgi:hypothetical protein